jgi:hypothetical protein
MVCICLLDCLPKKNKLIIDNRSDLTISAVDGDSFCGKLLGVSDRIPFGIDLENSKAVTFGTPGSLSNISCFNNSEGRWYFSGRVYTNSVSS